MSNLSFELQLINEYNILDNQYKWACSKLTEEKEKYKKLKNHHKTSVDLIQQLNHSVTKRNRILTEGLHEIDKLLNDLYEEIDEHYTETLENNDELAIVHAKAQLELITRIINEVGKV